MNEAVDRAWGPPDSDGVVAWYPTASRLARTRRAERGARRVDTLLGDDRALALALLKRGSDTVRAKTVFALAGNARHTAIDTLDYLLKQGWIELSERRRGSVWELVELRWRGADDLRVALGLESEVSHAAAREALLNSVPDDARLSLLHNSLRHLPRGTLVRRATLVSELDAWCAMEHTGTRAQFAQFAFQDTKALSAADWAWVERSADPESLGISKHTPAFFIRGPITLVTERGSFPLAAVPDFIALTPRTLESVTAIEGDHEGWLLVENRTSFEDVARRLGDRYVVVWMPGYVPDWWIAALQRLASLSTGMAFIAADPDPAGIEIALRAGTAFGERWQPWGMRPEDLAACGEGKRLSDFDLGRLVRLMDTPLPPMLAELARALLQRRRKGEQEGLDLVGVLGV